MSLLSPDIQRWLADAIGTGAITQSARVLAGSMSAALYGVQILHNGQALNLVLRLFTNAEWLADEPDLAAHEAAALRTASVIGIPTPELVAVDETGASCGVPAILMTRVSGAVELHPADFGAWLFRLAEALAAVHAADPGAFAWDYFTYNDVSNLQVPGWTRVPDLWARAIDIVRGPAPETPLRFIHRDYHLTNVLWQNSHISGVVDWVNACRGPAGIDLGHCGLNLASLYGAAAADRFARAYESAGGIQPHPYWNLLTLIDWLPEPGVYAPWRELGMAHLTDVLVRQRLDDHLTNTLARL